MYTLKLGATSHTCMYLNVMTHVTEQFKLEAYPHLLLLFHAQETALSLQILLYTTKM